MQRTAKVFMNNRSQAVRFPRNFSFPRPRSFIRRQGDEVVLSARPNDWSAYLASGAVARKGSWRGSKICRCRSARSDARYMLDTDISSYIMKRADEAVLRRLQRVAVSDVCISAITKAESMYGVESTAFGGRRTRRRSMNFCGTLRFWTSLRRRLLTMPSFPRPISGARERSSAERYAGSRRMPAVSGLRWRPTHREFGRVPGLKIENWTEPSG